MSELRNFTRGQGTVLSQTGFARAESNDPQPDREKRKQGGEIFANPSAA